MKKINIVIRSLLVLCIALMHSCQMCPSGQGVSFSIEESKKKGVFVKALSSESVNGLVTIKECWIEKCWTCKIENWKQCAKEEPGYQLIFTIDSNSLDNNIQYFGAGGGNWIMFDSSIHGRGVGTSGHGEKEVYQMDYDSMPNFPKAIFIKGDSNNFKKSFLSEPVETLIFK